MLLYIVRHAPAGQHGDPRYPNDSLRPLTRKGERRFSRLVKRLAEHGLAPTLVVTSPLSALPPDGRSPCRSGTRRAQIAGA